MNFELNEALLLKKNLKSQVEFKTNYINIYPWIFTFKFIHVTNQTKFETSWCPKTITLIEKKIPKENQIIISKILQNCEDDILKNNENNQTTLFLKTNIIKMFHYMYKPILINFY